MTTTLSKTKADYLDRVASGLADLPEDDREEVIQDLRAHLAELDEDEVEAALGSPEAFVAEFRSSAGLDDDRGSARKRSMTKARAWLEDTSRRLAEVIRWQTIRPVWIWTRGWLLISTFAVFAGGTAFRRFPIPTIEHSTTVGFALLAVATWVSVWLDRHKTSVREIGSFLFSTVVVLLLFSSLFWPRDIARTFDHEETVFYPDQLIAEDGSPIYNIYAYDLEGNPVQVLLFDQDGHPIRSLPSWVYQEAERNPGFMEPLEYGEGAVEFARDEFGRIIPNLYPLDLYQYAEYGLEQMPPPSLGFPRPDEAGSDPADDVVPTTVTPGPLD